MDRETKFWNKIADRYSRRPISDEVAYEKKLDITRKYFRPDMEVLEIGCGTGTTAIAHAPYVGHILATDLAPRMIEIATEKAKAANIDNVTFRASSVDALDLPDASIDAVMAHNLLHLLEDREPAIADIHRVLKPGGVFVTSTACLGDMMLPLRLIVPVGRFRVEGESRESGLRDRLRMAAEEECSRIHRLSKTLIHALTCRTRRLRIAALAHLQAILDFLYLVFCYGLELAENTGPRRVRAWQCAESIDDAETVQFAQASGKVRPRDEDAVGVQAGAASAQYVDPQPSLPPLKQQVPLPQGAIASKFRLTKAGCSFPVLGRVEFMAQDIVDVGFHFHPFLLFQG
jgi:SAM-dependent methyltransferase